MNRPIPGDQQRHIRLTDLRDGHPRDRRYVPRHHLQPGRHPRAAVVRSWSDHTLGSARRKTPVLRHVPPPQYAELASFRPGALPARPVWISTTDETGGRPACYQPTNAYPGGALNAAIANELGKLIADFTGRGATKSRAFVHQEIVVCVLEDGATRAERNLVAAGKSDLVRIQRDALQRAMGPQLIAAVERLTRPHRPHVHERHGRGGWILDRGVSPRPGAAGHGRRRTGVD